MVSLEKLAKLDSRIFFAIGTIIIIVPLLSPLGLPVPVTPYTKGLYDFINNLPAGSVVGMAADVSVGQWPALEPGWIAVLKLIFPRPLKLIFWSADATGPRCLELAMEQTKDWWKHRVYGADYAIFGYIPGVESAVASIASDVWGTLGRDKFGTPVSDLPVMQGVRTARDFAAVWCYEQGVGTLHSYLRHWAGTYKVPYILGTTPAGVMDYIRYYPVEVKGLLSGSLGAAELELLVKSPGKALQMMDVQNLIHVYLLILAAFGNAMYWGTRLKRTRAPEAVREKEAGS